ncbi:MAG: c-type cytochrome biogenesis protein CcsB [Proteobacteria bacterium]|nr:c-type cytochrome biogenesis protein CcsB [Pseudomonadota bacterium]
MTATLFLRLAAFTYLLGAAGFMVYLIRRNDQAARVATWIIGAGFGLHGLSILLRALASGQLPVLDLIGALGFFAWTLAGVYLVLYWRFGLLILGVFASPLILALVLGAAIIPPGPPQIAPILKSLWLTLHLGTVFTGYAFFGLAFGAGLMYLLQERQIKGKRTGTVYRRLPSLGILDDMNNYCLAIGFPMMTLGIITGAIYAQLTLGTYWRWDPKEVWSLVLWLVYAALLHQRLAVGWRGRRAAIMAVIGFTVLCFTFMGVSLWLPSYHSFESLRQMRVQ